MTQIKLQVLGCYINISLQIDALNIEYIDSLLIRNMAVSEDFFCKVVFSSKQSLDIENFIGKDSRLKINHSTFLALISRCQSYGLNPLTDYYRYAFVLVSPFYILKKRINSRVFRHQTLAFIVADVLKPLPAIVVSWLSPVFDEVIPLAVQYNESDFDFLIRVLAIKQCVSFFSLGDVFCLTIVGAQHLGIKSRKSSVCYHPIITIPVEGKSILAIQKIAKGDEVRFLATSFCSDFFLNDVLHLQNHPIKSFNQSYVVVGLEVVFEQSGQPLCYTLNLIAVNDGLVLSSHPCRVSHILPAKIISVSKNEKTAVNPHGSYALQFAFEKEPDEKSQQTVLRLHPFNGGKVAESGIHFPLLPKTWVLIQLIDGDFNQPVIIGAVHGASNPSPLSQKNHQAHLLQSNKGHYFLATKKHDCPSITLSTNDSAAFLSANVLQKTPVFLQSCLQGKIHFCGQKNIACYQGEKKLVAESFHVSGGQDCIFSSLSESVESSAQKAQKLFAQNDIFIQSQKESIYVAASQTQKVFVKDSVYWKTGGTSAKVLLKGQSFAWKIQKNGQWKSNTIKLSAGDSCFELTQAGLHVSASVFHLNAPVINVYGLTKP